MEHDLSALADCEVCWHIDPRWQAELPAAHGGDLLAWLGTGTARVVKHGTHRTVYRIDLPRQSFFLKRYRASGWIDRLRDLLRSSASEREYCRALELARRHLPAVAPVAFGQATNDNFLLTAAIDDATSLTDFVATQLPQLDVPDRTNMRRALLEALAELTAAAHDAGAYHNDPHSGNVLVRLEGGKPRLHWVDVPGVRLSAALSWRRCRANLVMMNWDWLDRVTRRERLRFFVHYLRHRRGWQSLDCRRALSEIALRTRRYGLRLMARRDKRALADNRDFYRFELQSQRVHAVRDVSTQRAAMLVNGAEVIRFPRRSDALRRWLIEHAQLARGIDVPRPLLVIPSAGLLVCERCPAGVPEGATDAAAVGRLLGRLHWWRINASKLTADHLRMVDGRAALAEASVVRFVRRMSKRQERRDLRRIARCWARNAACRRAFFQAYRDARSL